MRILPALAVTVFLIFSNAELPAAGLPVETSGLKWSLVRIPGGGPEIRDLLLSAGIEIISAEPDGSLLTLLATRDIDLLRSREVAFETVVEDYGRFLYDRNLAAARLAAGGQFATGSMGGYYSPAEILAFVDSLRQLDSHGILSDTSVVGLTLQGEPIWSVKISGGAVGQERPEVFYNSLTHSREGMSLMTLLYYMRFLVENYGQVDSVTDLVDSRDLYFIPLVNPDGYEINWQYYLNQKSFGLWRKNARDNNGDSKLDAYDGVDINRNFGFKW